MSKQKEKVSVECVNKEHRTMHKETIYQVRLTENSGTDHECVIQIGKEAAIGCISTCVDGKSKIETRCFTKKRTLQASVREFIKHNQNGVLTQGESNVAYSHLWSMDMRERESERRKKRKWRVHEVMSWKDGFFVARLSCNKLDKHDSRDTQYVIRVKRYQNAKNNELAVYTKHDVWADAVLVTKNVLENAIYYESWWGRLGEALRNVERGYETEREAKFGFIKACKVHSEEPGELREFKGVNSVRQVKEDNSIHIKIVDCYRGEGNRNAWLFESEGSYYIMSECQMEKGLIELVGKSCRSPLETPEKTARHLLSMLSKKWVFEQKVGREKGIKEWEEFIEKDLLSRYRKCMYQGNIAVTHIAVDKGKGKWVFKADLCPNNNGFGLPLCFKPIVKMGIIVEVGKNKGVYSIRDVSRDDRLISHGLTEEMFVTVLEGILGDSVDDKLLEKLEGILRWEMSIEDAREFDSEWEIETRGCEIHRLEAGICLLGEKHQANVQSSNIEKARSNIRRWHDDSDELLEEITKFEARLEKERKFPRQLIQVGLKNKLISISDINRIEYDENTLSDVLGIDFIDSDVKTENSNAVVDNEEQKCGEIKVDSVSKSTSKKKKRGRNRQHADDRARKREWARKKRNEQRELRKQEGSEELKRGRNKQFPDSAGRTRAYRLRNKYSSEKFKNICDGAGLIIVNWQTEMDPDPVLNEGIKAVLGWYTDEMENTSVYGTYFANQEKWINVRENGGSEEKDGKDLLAFELTKRIGGVKRVFINDKHYLSEELLTCIRDSGIDDWHICGTGISTGVYGAGMALLNEGKNPYFLIELCQAIDAEQHKIFRKQLSSVFGEGCLIK